MRKKFWSGRSRPAGGEAMSYQRSRDKPNPVKLAVKIKQHVPAWFTYPCTRKHFLDMHTRIASAWVAYESVEE